MNLDNLRIEIDKVDSELIRLLSKRFEYTQLVGEFKAENGIRSLSKSRESEQFERFQRLSEELALPYELVEKIFKIIRDQVLSNHERIKKEYEPK